MSEEQSKVEVSAEKAPGETLKDVLSKYEGAPSQEQIDSWKTQFGEVFVSGFSETDLYIWRPLGRQEYRQLQAATQDPQNQIDQFRYEEMVCEQCVVWKSNKSFTTWQNGKAGTCSTLLEQIMQNSNFMTPQAASMLVAKL